MKMSNEIIRISNIAKQHQKVDTVMYALNERNLKEFKGNGENHYYQFSYTSGIGRNV